eukprot:scaffold53688_cov57-Phaeocystis_antarctica.AAC.5
MAYVLMHRACTAHAPRMGRACIAHTAHAPRMHRAAPAACCAAAASWPSPSRSARAARAPPARAAAHAARGPRSRAADSRGATRADPWSARWLELGSRLGVRARVRANLLSNCCAARLSCSMVRPRVVLARKMATLLARFRLITCSFGPAASAPSERRPPPPPPPPLPRAAPPTPPRTPAAPSPRALLPPPVAPVTDVLGGLAPKSNSTCS